jgi:hypothetical protein
MQLEPSAEDQAMADGVAAFVRAKLLPPTQHIDESCEFVAGHLPALGEIGADWADTEQRLRFLPDTAAGGPSGPLP